MRSELTFTKDLYIYLLQSFLDKGYCFKQFDDPDHTHMGCVYLRHDIDFSIDKAYDMAVCDYNLGVSSTFFFLPSSDLYNLYSLKSLKLIEDIHRMGHDICLHVDAGSLANLKEIAYCFTKYFPYAKHDIIALHQPGKFIYQQEVPNEYINVNSTEFFKDIEYASDSGGEWKFGYPLYRRAFLESRSFQLLLHPLWWMTKADKKNEILKEFMEDIYQNTLQALQGFRFMEDIKNEIGGN